MINKDFIQLTRTNLAIFICKHLSLITLSILLIFFCLSCITDLLLPTLHCESLNTDSLIQLKSYEDWFNFLSENEKKDFEDRSFEFEIRFNQEFLDRYANDRFNLMWKELTLEQKEEFWKHHNGAFPYTIPTWAIYIMVAMLAAYNALK